MARGTGFMRQCRKKISCVRYKFEFVAAGTIRCLWLRLRVRGFQRISFQPTQRYSCVGWFLTVPLISLFRIYCLETMVPKFDWNSARLVTLSPLESMPNLDIPNIGIEKALNFYTIAHRQHGSSIIHQCCMVENVQNFERQCRAPCFSVRVVLTVYYTTYTTCPTIHGLSEIAEKFKFLL